MLKSHKIGFLLYLLSSAAMIGTIIGYFWLLTTYFHLSSANAAILVAFTLLLAAFVVSAIYAFATQGDDPKWSHR